MRVMEQTQSPLTSALANEKMLLNLQVIHIVLGCQKKEKKLKHMNCSRENNLESTEQFISNYEEMVQQCVHMVVCNPLHPSPYTHSNICRTQLTLKQQGMLQVHVRKEKYYENFKQTQKETAFFFSFHKGIFKYQSIHGMP